jgi:hypothetical protein
VILLIAPFCSHAEKPNFPQVLEKNGGDDETRTRDLCPDRLGIGVLSATYILSGGCQVVEKDCRNLSLWVISWARISRPECFLSFPFGSLKLAGSKQSQISCLDCAKKVFGLYSKQRAWKRPTAKFDYEQDLCFRNVIGN